MSLQILNRNVCCKSVVLGVKSKRVVFLKIVVNDSFV
jgi:hypothetical protein